MLQQRMNVFVKPCEQRDARINFVVARKRGAKLNTSTLLPLQGKESFGGFCYVHTLNSMSIAARDWYPNTFQRTSSDRDSDWMA